MHRRGDRPHHGDLGADGGVILCSVLATHHTRRGGSGEVQLLDGVRHHARLPHRESRPAVDAMVAQTSGCEGPLAFRSGICCTGRPVWLSAARGPDILLWSFVRTTVDSLLSPIDSVVQVLVIITNYYWKYYLADSVVR